MKRKVSWLRWGLLGILVGCVLVWLMITMMPTESVGDIEWTFRVSNGEASVVAIPRNTKGVVTIPSTLGGRPVTSIGEWAFRDCSGLTKVTISESVTSIGDRAFEECDGLMAVTFMGKPPEKMWWDKIGTNVLIRYPAKYESEWLPMLKKCGFSKHEAVK